MQKNVYFSCLIRLVASSPLLVVKQVDRQQDELSLSLRSASLRSSICASFDMKEGGMER